MSIADEVKEGLPKEAHITDVSFEGAEIAVYTKSREFFCSNETVVKELVRKIKKRIVVRPDPSITVDPEEAMKVIKDSVPKEAVIKDIIFEPAFGRVVIEAEKPGLVIGKGGETILDIKKKIFWQPSIKRAPLIASDVVTSVRRLLYKESDFRKDFLDKIGKKIHGKRIPDVEWARVTALGSFREVGRSCILLQTPHSKILMDCGIKPSTIPEYPYLNVSEFNISDLDAVILSHPHMDHCGFIPYLYEYGYKGPVYCTPPTRDLMVLLIMDYLDIAKREGDKTPYSMNALETCVKYIVTIDYDEVNDITPDVRLTFQNAGHILGSSVVHLHIGEGQHNLVYSADIKFDRTQMFDPTYTGFQRVETLILESTYGAAGDIQTNRREAEEKMVNALNEIMERGGKVLIPSFAIGRAQEIMCILSAAKFKYPVYLEGMLWDATAIHTTYPEYLSQNLQNLIFHKGENPFTDKSFHRVGSMQERKQVFELGGPCVVIATSGMLEGGPAMEYLKEFAEGEKNALMFVGYQAEGTIGRRIQNGWKEIPIKGESRKEALELKLQILTVDGLSGHSDHNQLLNYIYKLRSKPSKILVNHGEASKCKELARTIYKTFKIETVSPRNLETIRLK